MMQTSPRPLLHLLRRRWLPPSTSVACLHRAAPARTTASAFTVRCASTTAPNLVVGGVFLRPHAATDPGYLDDKRFPRGFHRVRLECNRRGFSTLLRGPTSDDLEHFRLILSNPDWSILSSLSVEGDAPASGDDDLLAKYNIDWTKQYRGASSLILRPSNVSEVQSILQYCNDNYLGIVPQGGNTGLCGGATPKSNNEIILSLERLNQIYGLDKSSGILTCDAGCILQSLQEYSSDHRYLFPLDIGSKGTSQIGGNVSTNAGGSHYFRFGSLHGTVMGMEVVLPNGKVMHLNMKPIGEGGDSTERKLTSGTHRKDNTGYDLKHLFIGAEGTLGIVTKLAIACPPLPSSKNATLLVCESYDKVLSVLQSAKEELGEILSALELMDTNTLQFVEEHNGVSGGGSNLLHEMLHSSHPTSDHRSMLFLLVETQGSNLEHDASKMDAFLTRLFESETIQNGFHAQDSKQMEEMWNVREACNPSVARAGCVYKYDVSVPIEDYVEVAREVEDKLSSDEVGVKEELTVCVWGHVADGNAHINVVTPGRFDKDASLSEAIDDAVFESVLSRNGSISAEHGLGQSKNEHLRHIKDEGVLEVMARVKELFDPRGIMNPGKYLPQSPES